MHRAIAKTRLLPAILILWAASSSGHGARIAWEVDGDWITITAAFDDGSPMDSAQTAVFSGADPMNPWITSHTDSSGVFSFQPDRELSLTWDVQVRKAGHGDIVHIALDQDEGATSGDTGFTAAQILIMAACVVWGFIGTALYFSARRRKG